MEVVHIISFGLIFWLGAGDELRCMVSSGMIQNQDVTAESITGIMPHIL